MSKRRKPQKLPTTQRKPEPTSLQTEVLTAQIGRVIAEHPSQRITPAKLKRIFEEAEQGHLRNQHELFLDIEEQDSNIAANMQTRKRALLTLDWHISEPRNATPQEKKWREEIDEFFYQFTGLEDLLVDLMDAVGHGFSALEIEWQFKNGKWLPLNLYHRCPSWFNLSSDDTLLLRTPTRIEGEPLRPYGWIVHTHQSRSTQLARRGVLRTLAWLYVFKHYSVHDFAEFLELYGLPIRIGKYSAGTTESEKRTLMRALAQIGHNAAGIMPESMDIELHHAASQTASDPFLHMIEWCEKSMARLILGQTLTSGADGKSSTNALGHVHNEVRRDLLISDAKQIAQTLTEQLIWPIMQLNIDPTIELSRIPYFEFDLKQREDLSQLANAIPQLIDVGVTIPEKWVLEKLGIPEPLENEPILKRPQTDFNPSLQTNEHTFKTNKEETLSLGCPCGCGQALSQKPFTETTEPEQRLIDDSVEQALAQPDFNAQLHPMVKQAVAILQACEDYEHAFEALAHHYPELDTREHQRYLSQAVFLSELLGVHNAR